MSKCGMCSHDAVHTATGILPPLHDWGTFTFCRWCVKGAQLKKEQALRQLLRGDPPCAKPEI